MKVINIMASFLVCVSTFVIIVLIFSKSKELYKNNFIKREILRLGLILISMGSLWNCVSATPTPKSEILLNIGMAITFVSFTYNKIFNKNK